MVEIDIKRIWKNIIKNRWKNAKKSGRKNEGRNKYRNNREVNSEDRLSTISMDFSWTVRGRTNMKSSIAVASFILSRHSLKEQSWERKNVLLWYPDFM